MSDGNEVVTGASLVSAGRGGNLNGSRNLSPLCVGAEGFEEEQFKQTGWDRNCDFSMMIIELCAGTKKKLTSNTTILQNVTKLNALWCWMNVTTRPCKDASGLSLLTSNGAK